MVMLVSVSVNPSPVTATPLLLVITKLMLDTPPCEIVDGLNDLVIVGGVSAVSVALAVAVFAAALVVVTPPMGMVFSMGPAVLLVTVTVIVQLAEAGMPPPDSDRLDPLAAAVTTGVAPPALQVVAAAGVRPLNRPGG